MLDAIQHVPLGDDSNLVTDMTETGGVRSGMISLINKGTTATNQPTILNTANSPPKVDESKHDIDESGDYNFNDCPVVGQLVRPPTT